MAPVVSVEPLSAAARAEQAGMEQLYAEMLGTKPKVLTHCVAVTDSFAIKDVLKAASYQWEPTRKAWCTPLRSLKTLEELQALSLRARFTLSGMSKAAERAKSVLSGLQTAADQPSVATPAASPVRRVTVRVAVEPTPAEEQARRAALIAFLNAAHDSDDERDDQLLKLLRVPSPPVAVKASNPAYRVAVRDCYAVKEHLKSDGFYYSWDASNLAWWTILEEDTLARLHALAQREKFDLRGMAEAMAAAQRALAAGGEQASPGGSPATAAAGPVRRSPGPAPARDSPYARPAPQCKLHNVACVLRTAGSGAMRANRGRRFWCCPSSTEETKSKCPWQWEESTTDIAEWVERNVVGFGGDGGSAMAAAGFGCYGVD